MDHHQLQLDAGHRRVTVSGRSTTLQEKPWQLLMLLRARAPAVVSRTEIIDVLWHGNYPTGDKGLNQAVWMLRRALGDDSREPRFIRTVPRQGYRWICADTAMAEPRGTNRRRRAGLLAAGLGTVAFASLVASRLAGPALDALDAEASAPPERVAVRAQRVGRDIHVEYASGCRGILKNEASSVLGTPVLSSDGARLAVTLGTGASCRLVTVDVATGQREDYGACPSEVI